MAIPKPKTRSGQIMVFLSGIFSAILALFYIFSKVDLVPDGLGIIGYIDDLIVFFLALFFVNKFIQRLRGRYTRSKGAYAELWRKGDLVKLFLQPKTWVTIVGLTAVFAYFFYALDVVPDTIIGLGYVDDALVAIGMLVTLIRMYAGKK